MAQVLIYGKEHTFLEKDTGLLFRNSKIHQTAALHTHTFYEIFVVAEGTALHMVNNAMQALTKGDLVFIRPEDTHTYEFHYSEDFRIINIGFSKIIFRSIRAFLDNFNGFQHLTSNELPLCVHLDDQAFSNVCQEFLNIGEYMKSSNPVFTNFYAKNCLSTIFVNYFFNYSGIHSSLESVPDWFSHMLEEMQKIENLQAGFSRMQELSPCSKNHLCRLFKKTMSVTPTQYINERRLEYAIYLLTQTNDDPLTISSMCGFNNLSHFYHLFKETYHISPIQFRKTGP